MFFTRVARIIRGGFAIIMSELGSAVHDGRAFSIGSYQKDLPNLATIIFLGITGSKQIHFDGFELSTSEAPLLVEFIEAPTVTANGTLGTPQNRNRNSSYASTMQIFLAPTITNGTGTIIDAELVTQKSQGNNKVSGTAQIEEGWVLKPNTKYAIQITNQSGNSININAKFTYHEADYIV